MRNVVLGILGIALLTPSISLASESSVVDLIFTDTTELSDDLKESILALIFADAVHGYGDQTFRPQATITRQEFLKLLISPILKEREETSQAIREGDIDAIIESALDERLIDRQLRDADMRQPITRAEAVRALIHAYSVDYDVRTFRESSFVDVTPTDGDLAEMITYLVNQGVVQGRDPLHFWPDTTLTRAEAAKLAHLAQENFLEENDEDSLFDDERDDNDSVQVGSYRVDIISVTPQSLVAGDDATMLFTVMTRRGTPLAGLTFADDLHVSVRKGQVEIVSESEVGNGLYMVEFDTERSAPAGPICIDVMLISSGRNSSDSTCDNSTSDNDDTDTDTASSTPLVRLVPSELETDQEGLIIATPQSHRGDPVSGLTLRASVVSGAATITQQMVESPAGTGIYVGKVTAASVPSDNLEIRVYIDNSATRSYGTIRTTVSY